MDSDQLKKELAVCSRCGGCKVACPTYNDSCHEGLSARGRLMIVKALLEGSIEPDDAACSHLYSCILCRACERSCPLGIHITEAICAGRAILNNLDRKKRVLQKIARFAAQRPELSFRILQMGRHLVLPALAKRGVIPFAPDLPDIPFRTLEQVHKVPRRKGRIAVFAGCSVNYLFPYLGVSLLNVIQTLGYEVVVPKEEVCCGAPLKALGLEREAIELAKKNYRVFSKLKVEAVLSLCPTCTVSLRHDYKEMIGKGIERAEDVSVFLGGKIQPELPHGKSAVYHDPCHLLHGLGISREPRALIQDAGFSLREPDEARCCGFGGIYCFLEKDRSNRFLEQSGQGLRSADADTVITSCPGCLLALGRSITDRPVLHLIEVIEDALCKDSEESARPQGEAAQR